MSASLVQQQTAATTSAVTSLAATLGTAATVGDLLVVMVYISPGQGPITGVSGGGVGTWARAAQAGSATTNYGYVETWWGVVTTSGSTSVTVTCTSSGSGEVFRFNVSERSGLGTSVVVSGTVGEYVSSSATTTMSSGTATPTAGPGLVIAQAHTSGGGASGSPSGGFTALSTPASGNNQFAYLTYTTPGSFSTTWSANSGNVEGTCVAFVSGATPGTASETTSFSGTATGAVGVAATASLTASFSGTATGTWKMVGAGSGSASFSGSATGAVGVPATAAHTVSFSGTAVGKVTIPATASLTVTFSATATGSTTETFAGTAALSASFAGTAVGAVSVAGTASLEIAFSATAVGKVPTPPHVFATSDQVNHRPLVKVVRRDPFADGEAAHWFKQLVRRPWQK